MNFYIVYVTAKDEEEGERIANRLLEERLIACANMFPIKSSYWWKGKIEKDNEIALIMKTQKKHIANITSKVKELHSYEVPCIEFIPIKGGNPEFLKWIEDETTVS
jgi:periplasmic divalent cation tolerance protein